MKTKSPQLHTEDPQAKIIRKQLERTEKWQGQGTFYANPSFVPNRTTQEYVERFATYCINNQLMFFIDVYTDAAVNYLARLHSTTVRFSFSQNTEISQSKVEMPYTACRWSFKLVVHCLWCQLQCHFSQLSIQFLSMIVYIRIFMSKIPSVKSLSYGPQIYMIKQMICIVIIFYIFIYFLIFRASCEVKLLIQFVA